MSQVRFGSLRSEASTWLPPPSCLLLGDRHTGFLSSFFSLTGQRVSSDPRGNDSTYFVPVQDLLTIHEASTKVLFGAKISGIGRMFCLFCLFFTSYPPTSLGIKRVHGQPTGLLQSQRRQEHQVGRGA